MPLINVKEFLDNQGIDYEIIFHRPAMTAQATATMAHILAQNLAKTVVVKIDGEMALAVVSASQRLDFGLLRTASRARTVTLASEGEFKDRFPECEPGAMPPFGNLYGMAVFVDEAVASHAQIVFNAGSHRELVRLAYADFDRLVAPTVTALAWAPFSARAA